jgi:hypothetical protein
MGAKCALPSVLSLLMSSDRGYTFSSSSNIGATASSAVSAASASATVTATNTKKPRRAAPHDF